MAIGRAMYKAFGISAIPIRQFHFDHGQYRVTMSGMTCRVDANTIRNGVDAAGHGAEFAEADGVRVGRARRIHRARACVAGINDRYAAG